MPALARFSAYLLADVGRPMTEGAWVLSLVCSAAGLFVAVVAVALAIWCLWRVYEARMNAGAHLVQILAPVEVGADGAETLWRLLAPLCVRPSWWLPASHMGFEFQWASQQLTIRLWVPGPVAVAPVVAAVAAAWPGATCTVTAASGPLPDAVYQAGGHVVPVLPAWGGLNTAHDADPLRGLLSAASGLCEGQVACVQVLARPAGRRYRRAFAGDVARLRQAGLPRGEAAAWMGQILGLFTAGTGAAAPSVVAGGGGVLRDRDARSGVDKLAGPLWQTAIRYGITSSRRPVTVTGQAMQAGFGAWAARNQLRQIPMGDPARVLARRALRAGFLLSVAELASIAGLPLDEAVPGLARARAKAVAPPPHLPEGGRSTKVLGRAETSGRSIALTAADARHHVHIVGSTGSGKSTLMCNMVLDDVHAGRGVVVIDPRGDLVTDVLQRLPASAAGRLVLIDPDQDPSAALNPLDAGDADLAVDNVVSIFHKIFARHWGPRMDDVMRVACLTLMRHANASLTMVPPLLNDKRFRTNFTADLDDPEGLHGFWEWYETTPIPLRAQLTGAVLARLRNLMLRDFVRKTFGPLRSSFDMAKVLDGGILLARLPKGQIGEDTTRLMGSFVLASVWQAATARIRLPEAERRDAAVYIDEAHNFLNLPGSVADILAEARGYGLGMVLAHQHLGQMPGEALEAIAANARTKVFFTCSPKDARELARHTMPYLSEHDLAHLGKYVAAVRLLAHGTETPAFTMRTAPPKPVMGVQAVLRQAAAAATGRQAVPGLAKLLKTRAARP
ncbi:type IV secretory system conjugative DNA transfer family protein [Catelliglobosispora koreensis]|uniref:type IV secretory system conjugative DNA transfer family protein n=1 Tax=Catelliglobosispora koreensis TaxID=129052 RepID=UPI00037F75DF|nr:type IV secretion system DNA-binding domain-containing protein [Catelliglobosispora koreensis]